MRAQSQTGDDNFMYALGIWDQHSWPCVREVIAWMSPEGRANLALPSELLDDEVCTALVADAIPKLGGLDLLSNNGDRHHALPFIVDAAARVSTPYDIVNVWLMPLHTDQGHAITRGIRLAVSTAKQSMPMPHATLRTTGRWTCSGTA